MREQGTGNGEQVTGNLVIFFSTVTVA